MSEFEQVNDFSNQLQNGQILIGINSNEFKYAKIINLLGNDIINLDNPYKIDLILNDNKKNSYEINVITMCKIQFIEESKSIINIKILDGQNEYSKICHYKELITSSVLKQSQNSKELIDLLKTYIDEKKGEKIIITKNNKNYLIYIKMQYEPKEFFYRIEISLNNNNKKFTCRNCNICLEKNKCSKITLKIVLLSKLMRIFFQIGEFYFSLIVLGVYIQTITIFITGTHKVNFPFLLILFFLIPILNIISILPLVLVFWETLQLRYLKNRNPYILIGRIFTSQELIDEENNIFGFIFDIISLILEILYIISFLCYNSTPKFFEFLNLLILIIIPGLKFLLIFGCTFIVGLIIVGVRIINICKRDKINEEKYVEENINKIKSIDYSDEYEPVRLLMHKGNRKSLKCFYIKFIGSCLLFFFFLFFFFFLYWTGGFILYFFLFFII